MVSFHTITLNDKDWVDEIVFSVNSKSADFNFGNIYVWDNQFRQLICRYENRMLVKIRRHGIPGFSFPIGTSSLYDAVMALKEFADYRGYPFHLFGVYKDARAELEELFPGKFSFTEMPHESDYIYLADKLCTYSGKALHGKKNHCNHFEKEYPDWQFVPITRELIPACLDMLNIWQEENSARLESSVAREHDAIIRAFAAYEKLSLEGGALVCGGKIVGFSIGELCAKDTFDVHFEKADISINGAYTMVCREMAKMASKNHPELVYINREEDMGFDALRQSKLSYKPEMMLTKYMAEWID